MSSFNQSEPFDEFFNESCVSEYASQDSTISYSSTNYSQKTNYSDSVDTDHDNLFDQENVENKATVVEMTNTSQNYYGQSAFVAPSYNYSSTYNDPMIVSNLAPLPMNSMANAVADVQSINKLATNGNTFMPNRIVASRTMTSVDYNSNFPTSIYNDYDLQFNSKILPGQMVTPNLVNNSLINNNLNSNNNNNNNSGNNNNNNNYMCYTGGNTGNSQPPNAYNHQSPMKPSFYSIYNCSEATPSGGHDQSHGNKKIHSDNVEIESKSKRTDPILANKDDAKKITSKLTSTSLGKSTEKIVNDIINHQLSDLDKKLELKRERNRIAARKCRDKKLNMIKQFEAQISELQSELKIHEDDVNRLNARKTELRLLLINYYCSRYQPNTFQQI